MSKCAAKRKRWGDKVDAVFSKMGDALSRADEKLTDKVNGMQSKIRFGNLFAVHEGEKVFSEWIREFRIQQRDIHEKALQTQKLLSSMADEDSRILVRALNGDIDSKTLKGDMARMYESFRSMIDENARELVSLGVLKEENAIRDYLKRYYKDFVDGSGSAKMYFDKRFKERKDMSLDERLAKGMIEDASFVIPKTIMEQKVQMLKARLLQGLSQRFGIDEAREGYVRVPDDTIGGGVYRYGALAGKFIPEEIMGQIKGAAFVKESMGVLETYIYPIVDHIKVNVTVKNPATHFYNVASNFMMSYIHGDMRALMRVLLMAKNDKISFKALVDEANKYGLNTLLDDMEGDLATSPDGKPNIMLTIMKNLYATADSKTGQAMRSAYEWEDKIFKLSAFEGNMRRMKKELGRDLNEAEKRRAFMEANAAYVDYDTPLPSIVRTLDKSGVFPFLHYTWKSTPVVARAIAKDPMRFMILQAALIGMGASAWFSEDDDIMKPEWAADQINLLGSKEWVNLGNGYFLNAGRLVPGMKIGTLDFQAGFVGGVVKIATGETPLGFSIGNKDDTKLDTVVKRSAALAENYAPPLSPIGRYGQRIEKKAMGDGKKNASTGKEMEYSEIMAQPIGVREFDPKHEAQSKANSIENAYKRQINNGRDPNDAAKEYRESVRELKAEARSNGISLPLGDNPPSKKKESGFGRVNIVPRLKL